MRTSRHRSWASHDLGRTRRLMLIAAAAVTILLSTGCVTPPPVPTDAQDACPLPAATFAGWFQSGSISLDGVVNPANSLLNLTPNCGFYQWSEQMFMWATSPAPPSYGGGAHIFDSPGFFDVSPPDASGNRTFLDTLAGPDTGVPFALRAARSARPAGRCGPFRKTARIQTTGREFKGDCPRLVRQAC